MISALRVLSAGITVLLPTVYRLRCNPTNEVANLKIQAMQLRLLYVPRQGVTCEAIQAMFLLQAQAISSRNLIIFFWSRLTIAGNYCTGKGCGKAMLIRLIYPGLGLRLICPGSWFLFLPCCGRDVHS